MGIMWCWDSKQRFTYVRQVLLSTSLAQYWLYDVDGNCKAGNDGNGEGRGVVPE